MKEKSLENKIEETLKSLDEIQRASAPVGFYDRLNDRIQTMDSIISPHWYHWLQAGVAALIILSILNGFFVVTSDAEATNTAGIQDFDNEYFETNASILNY